MTVEEIKKIDYQCSLIKEAIAFIEDICAQSDFSSREKDIQNLKEYRKKLQKLMSEEGNIRINTSDGGEIYLTREKANEICKSLIEMIEKILNDKFHVLPPEYDV